MEKILIISYSSISIDPRVLRQIKALKDNFDLFTAGVDDSGSGDESHYIQLTPKKILKVNQDDGFIGKNWTRVLFRIENYKPLFFNFLYKIGFRKSFQWLYWNESLMKDLIQLSTFPVDLILSNDIDSLPLATELSKKFKSKLVFDAHEYSPLQASQDQFWYKKYHLYLSYLCKKYVPLTDFNITVSDGIKTKYKELTGCKFNVMINAPEYQELKPKINTSNTIRFVHHGGITKERSTHKLVEAFLKSNGDIELNLVPINRNTDYVKNIMLASVNSDKIKFHEPVPTDKIPEFLNQFDVGIHFLPPNNFNHEYALPNKFFEFIQARLMVVIGPSPEMSRIVSKYDLGVISDGFEVQNILNTIESIKKIDVYKFKLNADLHAYRLSSNECSIELYNKIVKLLK